MGLLYTPKPQCQRQVGTRPTFLYNAVMIPRVVLCPHNAEPGEKFCHRHLDTSPAQRPGLLSGPAECDTQASGPQVTHENMPRNQE